MREHTLSDQPIQVLVAGSLDIQVAAADVVDSLVINHERAVRVLKGGVGGQDRVVRFDDGGRYLRCRVDRELQFALLAIIDRETLHQQGTETGTGTTTEGVEYKETLQTRAVVYQIGKPITLH